MMTRLLFEATLVALALVLALTLSAIYLALTGDAGHSIALIAFGGAMTVALGYSARRLRAYLGGR